MGNSATQRAAAVLEVLGVTAAGPLLMWGVRQLTGVSIVNPLNSLRADIAGDQLLVASWQMLELLAFQYCGYFLIAVPLNWWYRRRGRVAYGITRGGFSGGRLARAAIVAGAICAGPTLCMSLINSLHTSETAAWRQALLDMSWLRWQFWLFTGVMSWALIPVLEELFYRGYCLRRLAEDWGNGAAIVGSACLFTFMHTQYLVGNLYNLATFAGLLLFATGVGVVFAWTRSLIPGIAAHVLLNFPMTPLWQGLLLAGLLAVVVISWRPALGIAVQVFAGSRAWAVAVVACAAIGFDAVSLLQSLWTYSALAGLLLVAIALEMRERMRLAQAEPSTAS